MLGLVTHARNARLLALALAAAIGLAAATLATIAPGAADADHKRRARSAASCDDIRATAADTSIRTIRRSLRCLINAERRSRGLPRLRYNGRLRRAGYRHARDMARREYFSHTTPGGRDFVERAMRARYVRSSSRGWLLGENLAWGRGERSSARRIFRAWMRSRAHRRNILRRDFREIGIGVTRGAPVGSDRDAVTVAAEFGRHRSRRARASSLARKKRIWRRHHRIVHAKLRERCGADDPEDRGCRILDDRNEKYHRLLER